jgi:RNA polymerase sigma factor (TIGR02999 family)
MGDVTDVLAAARRGESDALGRVFELLYPQLRQLARARLHGGPRQLQINTTSLVHESFLRLTQLQRLDLEDRSHFFAYASRVMRSVIVDLVRQARSERAGGGFKLVTLDTAAGEQLAVSDDEVLRVHEALEDLAAIDQRLVRVVEMRYFVGLDMEEIAQALGLTRRTVSRDWDKARAFLYASLRRA